MCSVTASGLCWSVAFGCRGCPTCRWNVTAGCGVHGGSRWWMIAFMGRFMPAPSQARLPSLRQPVAEDIYGGPSQEGRDSPFKAAPRLKDPERVCFRQGSELRSVTGATPAHQGMCGFDTGQPVTTWPLPGARVEELKTMSPLAQHLALGTGADDAQQGTAVKVYAGDAALIGSHLHVQAAETVHGQPWE